MLNTKQKLIQYNPYCYNMPKQIENTIITWNACCDLGCFWEV